MWLQALSEVTPVLSQYSVLHSIPGNKNAPRIVNFYDPGALVSKLDWLPSDQTQGHFGEILATQE